MAMVTIALRRPHMHMQYIERLHDERTGQSVFIKLTCRSEHARRVHA